MKTKLELDEYINKLVKEQTERHLAIEVDLRTRMIYVIIGLILIIISVAAFSYDPYIIPKVNGLFLVFIVCYLFIYRYRTKRLEDKITNRKFEHNEMLLSHRVILKGFANAEYFYNIGLFMLLSSLHIIDIDNEDNIVYIILNLAIVIGIMYYIRVKQKENDKVLEYIGAELHINREKKRVKYFEEKLNIDLLEEREYVTYSYPEYNDYDNEEDEY